MDSATPSVAASSTRTAAEPCADNAADNTTFHPEHREVWAGCATATEVFLGNPRIPVGEKKRLAAEHDRASQVVAAIDQAATKERQ